MKVGQVTGNGASLTIRFMEPGDVPGCVAVFRRSPFPATATAVVDSRLLAWPAARIGQLLEQQPRVAADARR